MIRDMNKKGVEKKEPPPPKTASKDDFYAYLPQHEYMFVPTRTLWPAATINSILGEGAWSGPDAGIGSHHDELGSRRSHE